MSEKNDETQPVDAPTVRDETSPGWRERAYGLKGVAAVAVAGVIIGGGAGAAIHAATVDDGGRDGRPGFGRPGGPPGQMPGQPPQPPNGQRS